jgi:bifunctional non-homologous end joining protein LigD
MAIGKLPVRSCLIDGEAIVCDENGLAVFELVRRQGALASAELCAFDLLELDGRDLRRESIEERKRLLAKMLKGAHLSAVLNEFFEEDGAIVFIAKPGDPFTYYLPGDQKRRSSRRASV